MGLRADTKTGKHTGANPAGKPAVARFPAPGPGCAGGRRRYGRSANDQPAHTKHSHEGTPTMADTAITMPDGKAFEFWDDHTSYTKVYHVACRHRDASDDNPGTAARPFTTINHAAQVLEPGQKVIVHAGVYRERVAPARGGAGPDRMIAYEAARGEDVRVCGSRLWSAAFRPSEGWSAAAAGGRVWMGDLPAEWFVGFNPFMTCNFSSEYLTFTRDWRDEETLAFLRRRGQLFADGQPLKQVPRFADLAAAAGAFWIEDPGLRLHFRLPADADPAAVTLEVSVQDQVFAPRERGLGYVRVSGFTFQHGADGIPVPQRAMVSAARGHHWIIERNTIRHANAVGLDVGNETWHAPRRDGPVGHHVIRGNRISHCGACGLAGVIGMDGTLVENNLFEHIGDLDVERIWETAGLKFHVCDTVLIRRNVFRHIRHAPGLWLDYLNKNCRVTENVFADIQAIHGGLYLEVSQAPNQIDHNVFWDIRGDGAGPHGGAALDIDSGEEAVVLNNFFGRVRHDFAVRAHLGQAARPVDGRTGLCRRQQVRRNIFVETPKRILFGVATDNRSDDNFFDARNDTCSFAVTHPPPEALLNLAAWQEYYGQDRASRQGQLEAEFDPETLVLRVTVADPPPDVGPFPLRAGTRQQVVSAGPGKVAATGRKPGKRPRRA